MPNTERKSNGSSTRTERSSTNSRKSVCFFETEVGVAYFDPSGQLEELMDRAIGPGSVTAAEIAAILGTEELPVKYSHEWSIGVTDDVQTSRS